MEQYIKILNNLVYVWLCIVLFVLKTIKTENYIIYAPWNKLCTSPSIQKNNTYLDLKFNLDVFAAICRKIKAPEQMNKNVIYAG